MEKYESREPAHVSLCCGHVQGNLCWTQSENEERPCQVCSLTGPFTTLKMGFESLFWVDYLPPTHAFIPCGHMASENTVK